MTKISNGQQMLLNEALRLQDPEGKDIKWEKNEEGTVYTAPAYEEKPTEDKSGKKLAGTRQIYRLDVMPQIATVSVVQQVIDPEGTKKKTGEDARPKTVEEANASLAQGTGTAVGKTTTAEALKEADEENNKKHYKTNK
jgi:hypothetical protein